MNKAILIGNLVKDPELKTGQSGKTFCRFSLAVQRAFKDAQTGKRETDFFDCTAFDKTAEVLVKYCSKGKKILVEGAIQNHDYQTQDGGKRRSTEIKVERLELLGSKQDGSTGGGEFVKVDEDDDLPF